MAENDHLPSPRNGEYDDVMNLELPDYPARSLSYHLSEAPAEILGVITYK